MDGRNFKILRTGDFCLRIINLVKPSIKCQWRTKAMSDLQVSKSYLSHPLFHKKLENVLHQNEVIDKQRVSHKVPKTEIIPAATKGLTYLPKCPPMPRLSLLLSSQLWLPSTAFLTQMVQVPLCWAELCPEPRLPVPPELSLYTLTATC